MLDFKVPKVELDRKVLKVQLVLVRQPALKGLLEPLALPVDKVHRVQPVLQGFKVHRVLRGHLVVSVLKVFKVAVEQLVELVLVVLLVFRV